VRATAPVRSRTHTETRKSFRTTEFYLTLAFIAGVLIATYMDSDSLARADGWRYASFAAVAYIISRGLAKLGSGEPRTEEHDRNIR
jgi:hypothetical protein